MAHVATVQIVSKLTLIAVLWTVIAPLPGKPVKPAGMRTAIEMLDKRAVSQAIKCQALNGLKSVSRS